MRNFYVTDILVIHDGQFQLWLKRTGNVTVKNGFIIDSDRSPFTERGRCTAEDTQSP